jgi:hypothetical protein
MFVILVWLALGTIINDISLSSISNSCDIVPDSEDMVPPITAG